jgi:hypothetical protein
LEGASEFLKNVDCIWMEVSYFEIYFNTLLFEDMTDYCKKLGFDLFYHKQSQVNQNQGDALYIKRNLIL